MIVAGHQPEFLPYLGYFGKISRADVFVIVDNVQYEKKGFQNRNRIKTRTDWQWLTVPVITKGRYHQSIKEVQINNDVAWRRKHWRALLLNYESAPYFGSYRDFFNGVYSRKWATLAELNETLLRYLLRELGIEVEIFRGSDLGISGMKTGLLIDICRKTGAECYLSGAGGKAYVDEGLFKEQGLSHRIFEFHHPVYAQQFGEFMPNLSVIDALFNVGAEVKDLL